MSRENQIVAPDTIEKDRITYRKASWDEINIAIEDLGVKSGSVNLYRRSKSWLDLEIKAPKPQKPWQT